jgi:hypothetical protein
MLPGARTDATQGTQPGTGAVTRTGGRSGEREEGEAAGAAAERRAAPLLRRRRASCCSIMSLGSTRACTSASGLRSWRGVGLHEGAHVVVGFHEGAHGGDVGAGLRRREQVARAGAQGSAQEGDAGRAAAGRRAAPLPRRCRASRCCAERPSRAPYGCPVGLAAGASGVAGAPSLRTTSQRAPALA